MKKRERGLNRARVEGFETNEGVCTGRGGSKGRRIVASMIPPLSVASRFPDCVDWQVSESNSRSFTSFSSFHS